MKFGFMMFDDALRGRAERLLAMCEDRNLTVAFAESCTGGLLAGLITEISGSSRVFDRGFVTYSNAAKTECLSVPPAMLEAFGAVSAEVARAMADGVLAHSYADIAVSITGIAGPQGGSQEKPVGLVHFGYARRGRDTETLERRFGAIGRQAVRLEAINVAVDLLTLAAY
jgi:nicotinamide-nucleotide amidase